MKNAILAIFAFLVASLAGCAGPDTPAGKVDDPKKPPSPPGGFYCVKWQREFFEGRYESSLDAAEKGLATIEAKAEIDGKPLKEYECHLELLQFKGFSLMELKRPDDAAEVFKKVIETYPDSNSGYYNLGRIYARQKRYEEARKLVYKALELNPDQPEARRLYQLIIDKIQQKKISRPGTQQEKPASEENKP